jgi:hypothetical protein
MGLGKQDNLIIVGIICITVLEIVNMLTMKIDGNILSAVVGAIVFLITREYYRFRGERYGRRKSSPRSASPSSS